MTTLTFVRGSGHFVYFVKSPPVSHVNLLITIQSSLVYFKSRLSQVQRLFYFKFHAPLHGEVVMWGSALSDNHSAKRGFAQ